MFSGIIEATSIIRTSTQEKKNLVLEISKPKNWRISPGQSICVDGACLTATKITPGVFQVHCMPETLAKTIASSYRAGSVVNLERPLKAAAPVDGHFVSGHVDARVPITLVEKDKLGYRLSVRVPKELIRLCPKKGSVALNGVSLTIAEIRGAILTVALIPYTLRHTNLGLIKTGDQVNIEVDLIARYLEGLVRK